MALTYLCMVYGNLTSIFFTSISLKFTRNHKDYHQRLFLLRLLRHFLVKITSLLLI